MSDETGKLPPQRLRLAKSAHHGLDKILERDGFSPTGIEALLDFDAEMFRWRSMQSRGDFTAVMMAELDIGLEHGVFLGLLAISGRTFGIYEGAVRPPTIGEVAEDLKLDPSRASRIVAELVEKGFVRRDADQSDGRRIGLIFTPKGIRAIEQFRDVKWKLLSGLFADWSETEISDLARLMRKYLDGLQAKMQRKA